MTTSVVRVVVIAVLCASFGCKGKPKLDDIEGWIRAGQFTKVRDFVANPESPLDLKIQTIRKLVEYGQTTEVQNVLEEVPDRDEFVSALVKALLADLTEGEGAVQIESKDALFILMTYLSDARKDDIVKAIAEWAFEGLSAKSPRDALVQRIEQTRMFGQLNRMGQEGIPVAAWLISHGVETQSLQSYLAEAKSAETQAIVIAAIKHLFEMKDLVIPWEILNISRAFPTPQTVEFLVGVYLNKSFPKDAQSSALAAGQDLIYGVGGEKMATVHDTKEKRAIVVVALTKLMKSTLATDRWDAADMLLHVGGVETLDIIIGGLKSDIGSYVRWTPEGELEMPDFVIIQMCSIQLKPKIDIVRPMLEAWLSKGDAVQKGFSALCLKVLGAPASIDKLKALTTEPGESLEYLFYMTAERNRRRTLILEEKIPELTVALLAQNAIEGIGMLGELNARLGDKKMTGDEAELRALSIVSVIDFTGEQYIAAVEQAYQRKSTRPDDGDGDYDLDGASGTDGTGGGEAPATGGESPKPADSGDGK